MIEHPTLFRAPMVQAIMAGRKLQTRRVVSPANSLIDGRKVGRRGANFYGMPASIFWSGLAWSRARRDAGSSPAGNSGPYLHVPFPAEGTVHRIYPQWRPHDLLWVRETWLTTPAGIAYRADGGEHFGAGGKLPWKPSIFMPRWASRLSLRVTGIRVERLHEITEADAIAEGIDRVAGQYFRVYEKGYEGEATTAIPSYRSLWESINGPGAWDLNSHVWILDFVRIHRAAVAA